MVHSTRRGLRRAAAAAVATALLVAGCSQGQGPAPEAATVAPTLEPQKAAAPEPVVAPTWPLTGVAGDVVNRPALAVKIENTATARPQSGLEQADVVWETIVEFEVSRFVAVWQSQVPEELGPVRSVRPMDPDIVSPMHGLLTFSGGQPGILDLVAASPVQVISHDAGAAGLYRISSRSAPHNVYADPAALWAQADADHQSSPGEQFAFARTAERATAVVAGTPATTLAFDLSSQSKPSWTWNGTVWERSEGSKPAVAASGARLSATNVVSIVAEHPNTQFGAQNGAPVPTYTLVGSGEGTLATGGKTVAVRWQKDSRDAPMQLFTADGAPATLAPGNTWVELVPAGTGSLTVS
ncbi:DUF3048 domain-containing protein [Cellulomonas sp. IC4_254]|uniref:DUF3048 domain-containing protein n=1 Tax=Cellulomonas sp. IC4_254 TaxID=2714040 RepID=UPI00141EB2D8|nr:DUF3048 domain-containing protein [Cellulomonas sp. IC4_254]NHT16741.1 DUF3048 domain-containing protein [Cellulomonas sp. IC4_254]